MICMPLLKMVKLFTLKRVPIIGNWQKMDICDVVSVNLDKQDKKTQYTKYGLFWITQSFTQYERGSFELLLLNCFRKKLQEAEEFGNRLFGSPNNISTTRNISPSSVSAEKAGLEIKIV